MTTQTFDAGAAHPTTPVATSKLARYARHTGRVLLGLAFFVPAIMFFFKIGPQSSTEPMSAGAMAMAGGLMQSGYMFPLIKGTELVGGALLLSNRFVPLALVLLAPVVVNIFAFHAFLAPSGLALAAIILALEIALAWAYRSAYRALFVARN